MERRERPLHRFAINLVKVLAFMIVVLLLSSIMNRLIPDWLAPWVNLAALAIAGWLTVTGRIEFRSRS